MQQEGRWSGTLREKKKLCCVCCLFAAPVTACFSSILYPLTVISPSRTCLFFKKIGKEKLLVFRSTWTCWFARWAVNARLGSNSIQIQARGVRETSETKSRREFIAAALSSHIESSESFGYTRMRRGIDDSRGHDPREDPI
jgi:hypothetical protein